MNWITTNIRLPEDLYMDLKIKAARERKSVAAVIRAQLLVEEKKKTRKNKDLLRRLEVFREKMAGKNKGINLTQAVIDARYEE